MAKVAAAPSSLPSTSLQIGGAQGLKIVAPNPMAKRKTPSELRGEQLRRTSAKDESLVSPHTVSNNNSNNIDLDSGKRPDVQRNPRYIETRVDDVYPVKKSRLRMLSTKENGKLENVSIKQSCSIKNLTVLSNLAAKRQQLPCPENSCASASEDDTTKARQAAEKSSETVFRTVTQLSSGGERSSGLSVVDMDKALKGLVAAVPKATADLAVDSSKKFSSHTSIYSGDFCSDCHIPGQKAPLDFTLKTKMRVTSSCSVSWIQRSIMSSTYNGVPQLFSKSGCQEDGQILREALNSQVLSPKALHSWIYPQSTLPPSVVSVLASHAADGDFLQKRQLAWEDSFRSLYYMLRNNTCDIFYVCTSYFVAMFTMSGGSGETKHLCNAYISQSTRGLRSSLREYDVCFSMPLCHSNVEEVATEHLIELSEIEKQNLGQTRRRSSSSDVDNSPQSLLAFSGHKNVHGLYEFLLNYRSCLSFLSGVDVPVLYSPVPFQNAALSSPEIRCVEIRRPDSPKESTMGDGEPRKNLSVGISSSIEIKDAYIPSWIVCRICSLIGAEGRNFEASFMTERTSVGLNVALATASDKSSSEAAGSESLLENSNAFGMSEAILAPCLSSSFLKGLKYSDGSYTASLSKV